MATSKAIKGFSITCPICGDPESVVRISLNDLETCVCGSCDEEYSPSDARAKAEEQLARWTAIVRWTEAAGSFLAE